MQEDHEFRVKWGYVVKPCLKKELAAIGFSPLGRGLKLRVAASPLALCPEGLIRARG